MFTYFESVQKLVFYKKKLYGHIHTGQSESFGEGFIYFTVKKYTDRYISRQKKGTISDARLYLPPYRNKSPHKLTYQQHQDARFNYWLRFLLGYISIRLRL